MAPELGSRGTKTPLSAWQRQGSAGSHTALEEAPFPDSGHGFHPSTVRVADLVGGRQIGIVAAFASLYVT